MVRQSQQKPRKRLPIIGAVLGFLLVAASALILIPGMYYQSLSNSASLSPVVVHAEEISSKPNVIKGKPVRLVIPAAGIDLVVTDGIYDEASSSWSISNDFAHFATITSLPNNDRGNTFIYGHYRAGVFYTLNQVQSGKKAYVYTANGYRFVYEFKKMIETDPHDVDHLLAKSENKPVLTLQTCSGFWYQNRQLYTFDFVHVGKVKAN